MTGSGVVVVDHGIGNLGNVVRALAACGGTVALSDDPAVIAAADRLVLPGVGAFGDCMAEIAARGFVEPLMAFAETGRPLLGICVGMQILFDASAEFGETPGLGLIGGRVIAVPDTAADGTPQKVPHIGWSALLPPDGEDWCAADGILAGTAAGASVYFLHSFAGVPADPRDRVAECSYGGRRLCAVVRRGMLFGCQFHPEKSGPAGLAILSRFLEL